MIVLAVLIHLPLRIVGAFGVLMIALHNLLDRFHLEGWRGPQSPVPGFWTKMFFILPPGLRTFSGCYGFPEPHRICALSLIPWIGVMAAGLCFRHALPIECCATTTFAVNSRCGYDGRLSFLFARLIVMEILRIGRGRVTGSLQPSLF